jgi:microcystin degradation protein MlrC
VRNYVQGFIEVLDEAGAEMAGSVDAGTGVFGWVTVEAFDKYANALAEGLRATGKLDGVLLSLHGGMATREYPKPEAEIVRRVRAAVGDIPIFVTLDMHANEDHELTDVADAVFGCKEFPHTDTKETGIAAARCMMATLRGEFRPTMAIHKPGIISPAVRQWTKAPPMTDFRARADAWEQREKGIFYISIMPGFPYADVPDAGATVIALTNNDKLLAETVARDISAYMWERRADLAFKTVLNAAQAAERAIELVERGVRPVVLGDGSDRTGDNTMVLRELLERGARNVGLSTMHDPAAVKKCEQAGLGATITLSLGGWAQASGNPLEVTGKVEWLGNGDYIATGPMGTGGKALCGPSAVLDVGNGNKVVITSYNHQTRDDAGFRAFGIDFDALDIIILRSRVHFRAYYEQVAGEILEVEAPGMGPVNLSVLDYKHIPADAFPIGRHWRK